MDFLGVVGNSSNLPYQTNTVNYYYIGNEAIIYNGRGVINETNDFL
jgi:flagellar basal body L-ring protein FlgH